MTLQTETTTIEAPTIEDGNALARSPVSTIPEDDDHVEATETSETETAEEAPEPDETQERLIRLAKEARELKRRAKALEIENQALRGERQLSPNEEVMQAAAKIAEQKALDDKVNSLYQEGVEKHGGESFKQAILDLRETYGGNVPLDVIEATMATGEAPRLWKYLGENSDEAERIQGLSPAKMGVELAKLANKLTQKPVKQVSKAPAPIKPIDRNTGVVNKDPNEMSMQEYRAWREKQKYG